MTDFPGGFPRARTAKRQATEFRAAKETMMQLKHGPFTATFHSRCREVEVVAKLASGRDFVLYAHPLMILDRDLHDFDRYTVIAWPQMNAHERSQLSVLIRWAREHTWDVADWWRDDYDR